MQEERENYPRRREGAPRRRRKRKKRGGGGIAVLAAAVLVCVGVLAAVSLGGSRGDKDKTTPPPESAAPSITPLPPVQATAAPADTPAPAPTPTPAPAAYDYSAPAPGREAVGMEYFADAVFIGDSRTDGLELYSGIKGTTFLSYKGITVFDVMAENAKKVVEVGGERCTILDALGRGSYTKVYAALGVNELGYLDSGKFGAEYGKFIDAIRTRQPGAIIYVQSLVPVNPDKCKANNQPYWLTNEGVASYNEALRAVCEEKKVVFLDISEALVDENGILPADATVDGLHFTKDWYKKWLEYLMTHTVDPA